ncbi:putative RNA-binding protein [Mucilaginibacter sp. UYNi724]
MPQKYWIAVASKDHVASGVEGGFMQANHGKEAPLKKITPDDWVIFYSPKQTYSGKEPLQAFTAIGQVKNVEIYQHKMSEDFVPYRRDVHFYKCTEASINPLIPDLQFIENKKAWGFKFRFGFFEIPGHDFELIKSAMIRGELTHTTHI